MSRIVLCLLVLCAISAIPMSVAAQCEDEPVFTAAPEAVDISGCSPGVRLEWQDPESWGSASTGKYNIYRSQVSCADAPNHLIASCLTGNTYVDVTPGAGTYFYRIEAEAEGFCLTTAPCNRGNAAMSACVTVVDTFVVGGGCPAAGILCPTNTPANVTCPSSRGGNLSPLGAGASSYIGCPPLGTARSLTLNEDVYRLVFTERTTLDVLLFNFGARNPDLFLLSACNENSCIAAANTALHAPLLAPGIYYVVVDGAAADAGAYSISFNCESKADCTDPQSDLACGAAIGGSTAGELNKINDYACAPGLWGGPEVLYRFVNPALRTVTFALNGQPAGMSVFLLGSCDSADCWRGGGPSLTVNDLPAGTYYLVVDAPTGTSGGYTLSSVCTPAEGLPRWTACEDGWGATVPSTSIATLWRFDDHAYCVTNTASSGYPSGCAFDLYALADCGTEIKFEISDVETARLRVFDLTRGVYLPVTAQSPGGLSVGPALEVEWQDCDGLSPQTNNQVVTVTAADGSILCGVFRLEFEDMGGFLWTMVSNCTGSGGTQKFALFDSQPGAAALSAPRPEFSLSNFTKSGECTNLSLSVDVTNLGCAAASAQVRFSTVSASTTVTVGPIPSGGTLTANGMLFLADTTLISIAAQTDPSNLVVECSESATAAACGATTGVKQLDTTIDCSCSRPTVAIACGATVNGTTAGASNFNNYACTGRNLSGPEIIYRLTLVAPTTVRATLTSALNHDVLISSGTCSPDSCVAWGDTEATATLGAGDYFIVVDGVGGVAGSFQLAIECFSPSACTNPATLACNTLVQGNTTFGTNVRNSYSCNARTMAGPELVYRFDHAVAGDVIFDVTPGIDVDLELFLLSSCSPVSCITSGDRRIRVRNLAPGTYWLVVDGPTAGGPFDLTVACDPLGPALYEECFESGPAGWTTNGFWHRLTNPPTIVIPPPVNTFSFFPDFPNVYEACEGLSGFWYGENSTGTFIGPYTAQPPGTGGTSNSPNEGRLISPTISLIGQTAATLEFLSWWEIEGVDVNSFDIMNVQVSTNGGGSWTNAGQLNPIDDVDGQPPVPYGSDGFNTPIKTVLRPLVDLTPFVGNNIKIAFRFRTIDALYNAFRGWFVDCVRVFAGPVPPPIITAVEPYCNVVPSTLLRITGQNFVSGATVRFNGMLAAASAVISSTTILANIPSGLPCPGPITVSVTNPNGSSASLPAAFYCGANSCAALLSVSAGPDRTICAGSSVSIGGTPTANGGTPPYNYSWTPAAGLNSTTIANPIASPATTTTYTVTVIDNGGASNTDSVVVTVSANPAPAIAGPNAICSGQSATLDAGAGFASYLWSTGATTRTITVSPAVTTIYTVSVTNASGCSGVASKTLTVNSLPAPTIIGVDTICQGQSATLDAGGGYSSYLWSTGATTRSITVSPATTTTYSVTVTDANGCSREASKQLTVHPNPAPVIAGPAVICPGQAATLDAGPGYVTYLWSTGATTQTINVTPAATTTYTVTVSDDNGCSGLASKIVTVDTNPAPAITGPAAVCAGQSVILDAGAGFATYSWAPGGATTQAITVTPAATTTYTVTVTNASNCLGNDLHLVTVNANPAPAISGPAAVCAGQSVTLDAGAGFATYSWAPGGATTQTITVTPGATTTYTVTVTNASNCSGSASHLVTVNANPAPTITGASAVCAGQSVTLDAGAGFATYSWAPGGATTQTITVTPGATTTYTVTVTNASNCSGSDSHLVTVNANPAPTISGPAAVCAGQSVTLDAGAGFTTYSWAPGGATTQTITVTPGATTTYTVTVTNASNCSGSDSHLVTVNATPAPAITGAAAVCAGQSVTLDAGAGFATYSWAPGGATTQAITVTPGATTTYTVTVTNASNCSGSDSHLVTVNANPAPAITGAAAICAGQSVTLDAGAGFATYSWAPGGATTQTITVTPAATTTYTVTVTSAGSCSGSDSHLVTVDANPAPTITGASAVCAGQSVTLDAGAGFTTYSWAPGGATTQTITVTPAATTTYTVTVTSAGSCSGSDSHLVTVDANPAPAITGPAAVCAGQSVTLDAGAGFASYSWAPGGATTQTITVTPAATTTYTVTVTSAGSCSGSDSHLVTVDANPAPTITGASAVCAGQSVTLDAGAGFTTYSWAPGGATTQTITVTPAATTTYTVTVTSAGSCSGSDSHLVTVDANPAPAITGPAAVCAGQSVTLDAGAGFASYSWAPGGATTQTITVTPVATTTYTVTVTSAGSCSGSDSHLVTVDGNPAPTITGASAVCAGQSVTLDAGAGFASYSWAPGGATTQTITVTPAATTTYTVTVTSAGSCSGSDSHLVTVDANPAPTITGASAVCAGQSVTLDAGAGFTTYSWAPGGATTQTITVTPAATTTYTVTVTSAGSCSGSDSHLVTVDANPAPTITGASAVCAGQFVTLDAGAGFTTYSWAPGGATTQTITVTPAATTTYTVTVTSAGSCSGSDSHVVTVDANPAPAITGPAAVCAGQSVTLDAGAGFTTYSWAPGGATTQTITVTPAATTTYTVTVTSAGSCSGSDSHLVTVDANPAPAITGPVAVCAGQSVTLDAGAGFTTYSWAPGGATTQTITVTPAATTTYTVTVTSASGCSGSDSHLVTVDANPAPTITGPAAVCAGQSVTLDAGAGFTTYSWAPGGATTQTITVTPAATTTYTVTVTSAGSCSGSDSHLVTVDANPAPTISGPAAVCAGQSVTLDAGAGFTTYSWAPGGATTQTITVTPAATTTYTVTVTSAGSCSGSDSHLVTVDANPAPTISGPAAVCAGQSVTLDAGAGFTTYSWAPGGATTQTITVTPAATTTYTVTVTSAGSCSGSDSHLVTVDANPAPTITGASAVCAGQSVTLDAGAGFASYSWAPGGATTQTITVTPAATTTYTVTVTSAGSCSGSDSHTVTVSPGLNPVISGPFAVCTGQSATLDAGGGYASYLWSTGQTTQTITVSPASTTSYSVTVTDGGGCVGSASRTVTVNPLPTPTISGPIETCVGQSILLDAGGGYASYFWSTGATTQTISVSPLATTTYSVTVATAAGCAGSTSHTVTVYSQPAANAGTDKAITCTTTTVTLNGSASGGSGSFLYSWSPAAGLSNPNVAQPTTTIAGTWTLTVTDTATGCTSFDDVTVTLNNIPPVTTAGPDQLLDCTNNVVQLDGDTTATFFTFTWNPTAGLSNPNLIRPFCTVAGSYTLTVTDSVSGCVSSDTVVVNQNFLPPTANFTADRTTQCVNAPICFTSTSTNYLSLLWDFGTGTDFSSAPNPCFSWPNPGDYTVKLTATNNCGTNIRTLVVTISPTPVSNFSFSGAGGKLCKGNPINFTDTSSNSPTAWAWNFGDPASGALNTSTLQNPTHTYLVDGVYIATLTATNACGTGTTVTKTVSIAASCNTNCSANSNSFNCSSGTPGTVTGDTLIDFDNTNTSFYGCQPGISYGGENYTYDLNYNPGATYHIRLTQTGGPGYNLDIMVSSRCNPYECVAWGDSEIWFNDRGAGDYYLIVDGRNGTGGPYSLEITCPNPGQTTLCTAPTFAGVASATDADACALGGIAVNWNPVASWGNDNTGGVCALGTYEVLRALTSSPATETTVASGLTGLTFTDTSVVPGTSYIYRVNAINGCCGKPVITAATATAADTENASPVFGGITSATDVDACNASGVLIQWNPASSFGSPTGTYRVKRSTAVDCSAPTTVAASLIGTSYTDTTGDANQTYYYRVEAVSSCGVAADGGTGCMAARDVQGIGSEPSAQDITPAVTPLLASRAAGDAVALTWQANSPLYNVYRGTLASLRAADYDHQQIGACNLGAAAATVDPGQGNFYYLVTAKPCIGGQESSYGRNSIGQERPTALVASGNPCP